VSLEDELRQAMTLSGADLEAKGKKKIAEQFRPDMGLDVGVALSYSQVFLPLLAVQRDAILRLAREIDELRAGE
jgi:hypothetical protein